MNADTTAYTLLMVTQRAEIWHAHERATRTSSNIGTTQPPAGEYDLRFIDAKSGRMLPRRKGAGRGAAGHRHGELERKGALAEREREADEAQSSSEGLKPTLC
jgi:hypothetical protein